MFWKSTSERTSERTSAGPRAYGGWMLFLACTGAVFLADGGAGL